MIYIVKCIHQITDKMKKPVYILYLCTFRSEDAHIDIAQFKFYELRQKMIISNIVLSTQVEMMNALVRSRLKC